MKRIKLKSTIVLPTRVANYVLGNLPYFGYLMALLILYIYIAHSGQSRLSHYQKLNNELDQLRWHYLSAKSEVMKKGLQSNIRKAAGFSENSKQRSIPVIISKP